jgi:hypothetical protein
MVTRRSAIRHGFTVGELNGCVAELPMDQIQPLRSASRASQKSEIN